MQFPGPRGALSRSRRKLCSREHALRIAARMCDAGGQPVSIIRTDDPMQPFRISLAPREEDVVELQMVC